MQEALIIPEKSKLEELLEATSFPLQPIVSTKTPCRFLCLLRIETESGEDEELRYKYFTGIFLSPDVILTTRAMVGPEEDTELTEEDYSIIYPSEDNFKQKPPPPRAQGFARTSSTVDEMDFVLNQFSKTNYIFLKLSRNELITEANQPFPTIYSFKQIKTIIHNQRYKEKIEAHAHYLKNGPSEKEIPKAIQNQSARDIRLNPTSTEFSSLEETPLEDIAVYSFKSCQNPENGFQKCISRVVLEDETTLEIKYWFNGEDFYAGAPIFYRIHGSMYFFGIHEGRTPGKTKSKYSQTGWVFNETACSTVKALLQTSENSRKQQMKSQEEDPKGRATKRATSFKLAGNKGEDKIIDENLLIGWKNESDRVRIVDEEMKDNPRANKRLSKVSFFNAPKLEDNKIVENVEILKEDPSSLIEQLKTALMRHFVFSSLDPTTL